MTNPEAHIWELLAKKICNEASGQEISELDKLLHSKNHLSMQRAMQILENYWNDLHLASESNDIKNRTKEFLQRVSLEINSDHPFEEFDYTRKKNFFKRGYLRFVAAAVLLIACIAGTIYISQKTYLKKIASGSNDRKQFTLPDGTEVWLNAKSIISYPENYLSRKRREINLTGEAFFKVKHDNKHPFLIHTDYGIDIEDIGTVFNVKAYPNEGSMETTLLNGAVEIYEKQSPGQKLLLQPKQKFVYKKKGGSTTTRADMLLKNNLVSAGTMNNEEFAIVKIGQVVNKEGDSLAGETAWVQNQLAFVSEPFSVLAERMSNRYDIKINIQDSSIENYRFTGVFEDESITQALDELRLIRPFHYTEDSSRHIEITP